MRVEQIATLDRLEVVGKNTNHRGFLVLFQTIPEKPELLPEMEKTKEAELDFCFILDGS